MAEEFGHEAVPILDEDPGTPANIGVVLRDFARLRQMADPGFPIKCADACAYAERVGVLRFEHWLDLISAADLVFLTYHADQTAAKKLL